jgi:hypothetical protein
MKKRKQKRTLKNMFYIIIIAFAIVAFWRGIWGLMDFYLFPKNQVLSFSLSILIGVLILYATKNLLKKLT